jgi:hypothetical protein
MMLASLACSLGNLPCHLNMAHQYSLRAPTLKKKRNAVILAIVHRAPYCVMWAREDMLFRSTFPSANNQLMTNFVFMTSYSVIIFILPSHYSYRFFVLTCLFLRNLAVFEVWLVEQDEVTLELLPVRADSLYIGQFSWRHLRGVKYSPILQVHFLLNLQTICKSLKDICLIELLLTWGMASLLLLDAVPPIPEVCPYNCIDQ